MEKLTTIISLVVIFVAVTLTAVTLHNADADLEYVRSHPVIRTVYRNVSVPHRSDDVNEIFVKAGRYCKGDGGAGAIVLYPHVQKNWEVLCAWGHETYTDRGMSLEVGAR